jgi:preprotein translocase subunit YajC
MSKKFAFLIPLFSTASLFADGAAPAGNQNFMQTIIMIGLALVFFYFILWRPEQKRRKAMTQQREAMKKGDKVTAMGIVGTVFKIQEQTVILKMVDGAKVEMLKTAITDVKPATEEEAKRAEKEATAE